VPAARLGDLAARFTDATHRLEVFISGDLHNFPVGFRPPYAVRAMSSGA
jgi:hypothetical protein